MRLRFNQTLAGPSEWYPLGLVLTIQAPTAEQRRWIEAGIVSVLRDDPALETPERPLSLEARADGRPFVPRRCPSGIVVCIGGGPSLTAEDVNAVRGRATVIAVNDAWRLAEWADVLYAADGAWWKRYWPAVKGLPAAKVSIQSNSSWTPEGGGVTLLENTGSDGLELEPTGLRTGNNSGYQAINLAVHLGARRIVLLGYDMGHAKGTPSHWFGEHPKPLNRNSPYHLFRERLETIVEPLRALGVEVINCSRETALTAFRRDALASVFAEQPVA